MKKIRIGIELDHVIRDVNRQIVKYYQRDIDPYLDIDDVDMKDDVIRTVCNFDGKRAMDTFLYEDYPLEVFGHAGQVTRNLSRDLNQWLQDLTNQEKYEVEVFFYSMKEFNLTIQSSYFFLSKIGSRVRKVLFPKSYDKLSEDGDVFITANPSSAKELNKLGKGVILVRMNFNKFCDVYADETVNDFREFLDDKDKLEKIAKIIKEKEDTCQSRNKERSLWTLMQSWISSLLQRKRGTRT